MLENSAMVPKIALGCRKRSKKIEIGSDNNVKHVDNVPVQTHHERKTSMSSCSSDILPSAKGERFDKL